MFYREHLDKALTKAEWRDVFKNISFVQGAACKTANQISNNSRIIYVCSSVLELLIGVHVDSLENMAKLVYLYVMLSTNVNDIVYLLRLFRSPQNGNFCGLKF